MVNKKIAFSKEKLIESGQYKNFCKKISDGMIQAYKNGVLTGKASTEELEKLRRKRISDTMKLKKLGGYRKGSGRGKQGWYKGFWCDSSWELAWVIYNLDHNIIFEKNWEKFEYIFNGKIHNYIPDFKIKDEFIEIKGYMTEQTEEKIKQFSYKIKLIGKKDLEPIIKYVEEKYGKDYIKLYN
jgi:hypothetical protein